MKKFKFRFNALKKVREYELDKAKEILDEAVVYRMKCEESVVSMEEEIEELINELSKLSSSEKLEIHLIMNMRNFIAVKRLYLANEKEKVKKAFEIEEEKRNEYIASRCEIRKIELIEEKDIERYKKEFLKNESKLLDEMASRKRMI
ncbi:flagellar FliJ family protein [bacterium]|nr:flagellar FliJ family protein [bacterium]